LDNFLSRYFHKNNDRDSLFFKSTLLNFILIGIKILIGLLLIPFLLKILGKERFGIWQTLLSFGSIASIINFGFGNGLRNLISKLIIKKNNDFIGLYISSTFIKLFKNLLLSSLFIFPIVYLFFEPSSFFLNSTINSKEIKDAVLIFTIFFVINTFLSLTESICYGFHKSYIPNLIQVLYLALSFLLIWIISIFNTLNLIIVAALFGITLLVIYLLSLKYLNKKLNLKIDFKQRIPITEINNLSIYFFVSQALSIIFISADNFFISKYFGANQTAEYSIVNKIFFTIIMLYSIVLIHFWNSVTDAYERKEYLWIKKSSKNLIYLAFIFFIFSLVLSYFQKPLVKFWIGDRMEFEYSTFYLFTVYTLFHCINALFVNIQNGIGYLKIQIISNIVVLVLYFLSIYFINLTHYDYNMIIKIKIILMFILIGFNSTILLKIKHANVN
jgi:O-antigen/teichoic acid export membrane protein